MCLDPCLAVDCGGHGSCAAGACVCEGDWTGDVCNTGPIGIGATIRIDASQSTEAANIADNDLTTSDAFEYGATLFNGRPGFNTDGASVFFDNVQLNAAATFFAVVQSDANTGANKGLRNWGCVFWHGEHDQDFGLEQVSNSGNMNMQTRNDNSGCLIPNVHDVPTIWSGRIDAAGRVFAKITNDLGSSLKVQSTGSCQGTAGGRPSPGLKRLAIGSNRNDDRAEKFNGLVAELIYYNTPLTDADMQATEAALFEKWLA